jgi:DNA-binding NarL/FixJ family response regulator
MGIEPMKKRPIQRNGVMKRKIFLVDDHPLVRQALAQLISQEPDLIAAGEAGDIDAGLKGIAQTKPDIVVADLSLNSCSGLRLIDEVHLRWPNIRVLVLSMHDEAIYAEPCLRAGASGYLMKSESPERVIDALRKIAAGKIAISDNEASKMLSSITRGSKDLSSAQTRFTNRELEIFQMLGQGLSPKDIAQKTHRSVKTIHTHLDRIKKKLHIQDHRQLLLHASRAVNEQFIKG